MSWVTVSDFSRASYILKKSHAKPELSDVA